MNGLNKVFLMGHIGNDPELTPSKNGKPFTRLSVATRQYRPPQEGSEKGGEHTMWHSVFVWGKLGETCAQYLRKGAPIFVEGYLNSYSTERDGEKQYGLSVVANKVEFFPNKAVRVTPEPAFES